MTDTKVIHYLGYLLECNTLWNDPSAPLQHQQQRSSGSGRGGACMTRPMTHVYVCRREPRGTGFRLVNEKIVIAYRIAVVLL